MTTSASNPFALCADKMRTPCTSRSGFPTGTPFLLQADRKSTRLNSSHSQISYAVFCLKKKKRLHVVPQPGQTVQGQARDARYAFFARVRREYGLTAVATGHTADDQAETVLIRLVRGSGTSGLAGIPVQRGDGIIRPLLDVTRAQVLDYLASRGFVYRTDASNA